jgi:hypothetical protein
MRQPANTSLHTVSVVTNGASWSYFLSQHNYGAIFGVTLACITVEPGSMTAMAPTCGRSLLGRQDG